MSPRVRFLFYVITGQLTAMAALAAGPAIDKSQEIKTGVDLKIDATSGWRDGGRVGSSLQGTVLAHADWQPSTNEGSPAWHGYASLLGVAGRGPTEKYLGDFLSASNLEAEQGLRVYSWWIERTAGTWSLRTGALLADEEFATTECGSHFLNSSLGWPAFISANTVNTGPAYSAAALGVRVCWTPSDAVTCRLGIYDGDSFDSPTGDPGVNRSGLHYQLGGSQGWFVIGETTWQPAALSSTILKCGAWLHTADFADVYRDNTGQPQALTGNPAAVRHGNYGAYASAEHAFYGKGGEPGSMSGEIRAGVSPADRNTLSWAFDASLHWHGPIASRPLDAVSIGLSHAQCSPDFSRNARLSSPTEPAPDYEQVVELVYDYSVKEGVVVQPDVQWIMHTGASRALPDSLLLAMRLSVSY